MTPPAPRSSGRWSPRCRDRAPTSARGGWPPISCVEQGRVVGVHGDRARRSRDGAGPPRARRHRRRRPVLRRHHQPRPLHRRRHRHGDARRRRGRRPRVHAVPPHRAAPPVDAAAAALRGAAGRGRDPARRARRGVHGRRAPARPTSRPATSWPRRSAVASSTATSTTSGSTPPPSTTSRRGSRPSGRRAARSGSTPPTTGCRWRPRRTTSRAASAPTSTARRPCPGSGRAARPRARRARRQPAGVELAARGAGVRGARGGGDPRRADGPERTGVLRGIAVREPVARSRLTRWRSRAGPSIREELQRVMTRGAGVVRSAESLERAADALATMTATDVESANLLTVSTALGAGRDHSTRVARHAHPRRLPGAVDRVPRSPRVHRGSDAGLRAAVGTASEPDHERERVRPAGPRRCARWWRARWPRTSGRSVTSPPSLVPADACASVDVMARADGVLAGTACADEVFAQVDPAVQVRVARSTTATSSPPGPRSATVSGTVAVGAHRRTQRAQLPLPPVGRRIAHPPVRRRRRPVARIWDTRKTLPGAAGGREGGGARRRWREPPGHALRVRAGQGQPPRRSRHHAKRSAARTRAGPGARSRSSATAPSRCRRRSRPAPPWCCSTT